MNYCMMLILAGELCSVSHSLHALQAVKTKMPEIAYSSIMSDQSPLVMKVGSKWVVTCTREQMIFAGSLTGALLLGFAIYYRKHGMAKALNLWDRMRSIEITQERLDHELYKAAQREDKDAVEMWWLRGAKINSTAQDGTPLHAAFYAGNEIIARWLMDHGAKINSIDRKRETPLVKTIANPKAKTSALVHLAMENRADIMIQNNARQTALTHAVMHPTRETLGILDKMLTSADPDDAAIMRDNALINAQDEAGETPLLKLIADYPAPQDLELVNAIACYLIEAGADIHLYDKAGHDALWRAVDAGLNQVVMSLLNRARDWSGHMPELQEALKCAVAKKRNRCIDPIFNELVAKEIASMGKNKQEVEQAYEIMMIEHALYLSHQKKSQDILKFLLDQRKDKLTEPVFAASLFYAIELHRKDLVEMLINAYGSINIKELLNIKNDKGQTPLMVAIERGYTDITLYLLSKPNLDIRHGNQVHVVASERGLAALYCTSFLQMINEQDHEGNTALHYAVAKNNRDAVEALIEVNADAQIQNKAAQTALQLARNKGFAPIANLLLEKAKAKETNSYRYNNNLSTYFGWGH